MKQHMIPDLVLLDTNMPEMDGYDTAKWLYVNYPQIKILALSMQNDEGRYPMLRLEPKDTTKTLTRRIQPGADVCNKKILPV